MGSLEALPHNKMYCEIEGCTVSFSANWGLTARGRHHCRQCGNSVCDTHFVRPRCVGCVPTPLVGQRVEVRGLLKGTLNGKQGVALSCGRAGIEPQTSLALPAARMLLASRHSLAACVVPDC